MMTYLRQARTRARWAQREISKAQTCAAHLNKFGVVVDLEDVRTTAKKLVRLLDNATNQKDIL